MTDKNYFLQAKELKQIMRLTLYKNPSTGNKKARQRRNMKDQNIGIKTFTECVRFFYS